MNAAAHARRLTPLKRLIAAALLAIAVAGVQQAAVLHWLSHSIEAARKQGRDVGAPLAADHCDACLAFSGLGSGATAAAGLASVPPSAGPGVARAADAGARPTPPRLAFRSRAPPSGV